MSAQDTLKMHSNIDAYPSKSNKCEMGTQTEVHLVPSHKDHNYSWNEWDHRRQAIQTVLPR